MTRRLFDERKCIVCGCTDEWGCSEGCEWITIDPPVCSCCLSSWAIAVLVGRVTLKRPLNAGQLRAVEHVQQLLSILKEDYANHLGVPSPRQMRRIVRCDQKWREQNRPAAKRRTRRGAKSR